MSGLLVEVLFKGKVLQTVPFERGTLRIGRMRENEIVIDNLAVSRFHARLQLVDGHVFFDDNGSENGSFVGGVRVHGRVEITPSDTIAIGKHQLRVRSRLAEGEAPVAKPSAARRSDPWDAAQTYFAGPETRAQLLADAAPPGSPTPKAVAPPAASAPPVPGSEEPAAMRSDKPERQEPDFELGRVGDSLFDLAAPDDAEPVELAPEVDDDHVAPALPAVPESGSASAEPEIERPPERSGLYAGLIVQRDGKIERVAPWNEELLTVGRASDCDLVLGQDEVSRRHAQFRRSGDRYEVLDLGSVNGTLVNGKRVDHRVLEVGDVIQVEGFQLTFVLDRQPIEGAMKPAAGAAPPVDSRLMTILQEDAMEMLPDEAPQPNDPALAPAAGDGGELELLDSVELEDTAEAEAEAEESKPLAAVRPRGSSRASSLQDLGPVTDAPRALVLELRLPLEALPERLRLALGEAEIDELVVPAELHLRTPR
jgi:pSer/pThr/pTyr-binding forkhead associated (FHA) protein